MKTRPISALVLLAVLSAALASSLSAASASTPATAYPVGAVERHGVMAVRPGDSATKVVAWLGNPDQRLSSDTWVYRRFQSKPDPAHAADCTTLLITFNQGRVADLMKLNEPAVRVIAAKLAAPQPAAQLLAGK